MPYVTQNIRQVSPLLVGRSEDDIMKFLLNQNNNNWRRRNGYPMKRKGLNKRKKGIKKYFMVDESSTMKRMRKLNSAVN